MKVPDIQNVVHGLDPARQGRPAHLHGPVAPRETRNADGDRLDIALSSRILGVSTDVAESVAALDPELSAERQEEIRQRVQAGFYNADERLEDTGQRILDFYAH